MLLFLAVRIIWPVSSPINISATRIVLPSGLALLTTVFEVITFTLRLSPFESGCKFETFETIEITFKIKKKYSQY